MRIYVGCSLTQAPEDFVRHVEAVKAELRKKYEIFEFVGLVDGTDNDVYRGDIHTNIALCDAFVAICDYPAIGLGYEMGVAVEKYGKPVLALAQTDAKVTRLVKGIDHPHYTFCRYKDTAELLALAEDFLQNKV